MDFRHMAAGTPRLSEQDRGAALDQLRDAYTDGVFDHGELDRRMHVVLTATDGSELEGVLSDLSPAPAVIPKDNSWRVAVGVLAATAVVAVGVLLYVGVSLGASTPMSLEEDMCLSTGMSSFELECPDLTGEQAEIEQWSEMASDAASQSLEISFYEDIGPNAERASEAAEAAGAAAAQARQAVREGRAIMADALFEEPAVGAFDAAVAKARSAARDAVQALNEAESALES